MADPTDDPKTPAAAAGGDAPVTDAQVPAAARRDGAPAKDAQSQPAAAHGEGAPVTDAQVKPAAARRDEAPADDAQVNPAAAPGKGAPVKDAQAQPAATKAVEAAKSVEERKQDVKAALKAEAAELAGKPKPKASPEKPAQDPNALPLPPPWYKTLRADPPAVVSAVLGLGLIALLLLVWWFVTRGAPTDRIVSPSKLPSPGEVFGSFGALMDRELVESIFTTLDRVFKGVALAALVGISLGVLAASNRGVGAALAPLVIFLRSVPMGALIPLTLMLFSDGEKQKWMFIFLAIVPFVFSDALKAISIVPERYVETAQTLGASKFQIIRKVLLPLALPDIITSLRFQLGLALGYIMLVEIINSPRGIGALFLGSERQGLFEHTYLLLFVVALIAFTLDLVLRTLQRGIFAWRKDL